MDDREDMPSESIGAQEMTEKPGNISEAIGFIAMNRIVICGEGFLEQVGPKSIELCKSFTDKSEKLGISFLLRAALDNH